MTAQWWCPWRVWTRETWCMGVAFAACLLLFAWWPELDLRLAAALWSPDAGFVHAAHPLVRGTYIAVPWLTRALMAGVAVWALVAWWRPASASRRRRRQLALLLATAVLGLGGVVDAGLKDHWGRPRPLQITAFGGSQPFQPALQPGGGCGRNCSFVSGHAASGALLLALGMVGPPTWRRRALAAGALATLLIGATRMLQGGHFLSDVLFAFFAIWATAQALRSMHDVWRYWRWRHRRRRPARPGSGQFGSAGQIGAAA